MSYADVVRSGSAAVARKAAPQPIGQERADVHALLAGNDGEGVAAVRLHDAVRVVRAELMAPDARFRFSTADEATTAASTPLEYLAQSAAENDFHWLTSTVGRRYVHLALQRFAADRAAAGAPAWSAWELRHFLVPDENAVDLEATLCRTLVQHLPALVHGLLAYRVIVRAV